MEAAATITKEVDFQREVLFLGLFFQFDSLLFKPRDQLFSHSGLAPVGRPP